MSAKATFALSLFAVLLAASLIMILSFLQNLTGVDEARGVEYTTAFERTGIAASNFKIPGSTGGLRISGDLLMSSDFELNSLVIKDIHQYIDPKNDVLNKDYYRLWQLKTPFWLEKHAASDTVFVYCGMDTLYVLLTEIP